jgi:hypothetical protein
MAAPPGFFVAMRTYDKLIETIRAGQGAGGMRSPLGSGYGIG